MRILQILVMKLLCALALIVGVLMVASRFTPTVSQSVQEQWTRFQGWPAIVQSAFYIVLGVLLVAMALLGLLPTLRRRRGRQISFTGPHGDVAFDLDSVAATIERVILKLPEVNKIKTTVVPVDDDHKAEVTAEVVLNPPNAGARQAALRVGNQLRHTAIQILGAEQVSHVELIIKRILVDVKKLATEEPAPEEAILAAGAAGPTTEIEGLEEAEQEAREEMEEARERIRARETREAAPTPELGVAGGAAAAGAAAGALADRDTTELDADVSEPEPETLVEPTDTAAEQAEELGVDEPVAEDYGSPIESQTSPWDEPLPYEAPREDAEAHAAPEAMDNLPGLGDLTSETETPVPLEPRWTEDGDPDSQSDRTAHPDSDLTADLDSDRASDFEREELLLENEEQPLLENERDDELLLPDAEGEPRLPNPDADDEEAQRP
jgi:hypothetical protein